ncbi:hypothetical protein [Staphylococcus capitis]|uniref:hypothetical protein n=1 Tax=Staphylococcus capitis TaxID=29388 RepID=UPI003817085A
MLKKFFAVILASIIVISFIGIDNTHAKKLPKKYSGAVVHKTATYKAAGRKVYSQELYTFYMKPKKARKFASKVDKSSGRQIGEFLVASAASKAPGGWLIGVGSLIDSLNRGEFAGAIRKQSEKGPVKFTISHNPYATVHSKVTKWNGRTISTKSTKNNKYKSKKYLK